MFTLSYECYNPESSHLAKNICDKLEATSLQSDTETKYMVKHPRLSVCQI